MCDVRRPSTSMLRWGSKSRAHVENTVRRLWNLGPSTRKFYNMSPNPVSILRATLQDIVRTPEKRRNYAIGAKTDGVRYMMVVTQGCENDGEDGMMVVLINRRAEMFVFSYGRTMPQNIAQENMLRPYAEGTVFDGELVATPNGFEYWIFDTVAIKGVSLRTDDSRHPPVYLRDREKYYQTFVRETGDLFAREWNITMRPKPFFPLSTEGYTQLQQWTDAQKHVVDGFILAPLDDIIRQNTQDNMYKVKTMHTIDLRFVIDFTGFPKVQIREATFKDIIYGRNGKPATERSVDVRSFHSTSSAPRRPPTLPGSVQSGADAAPRRQDADHRSRIMDEKRVEIADSYKLIHRLGQRVHGQASSGTKQVVRVIIECLVSVPSSKAPQSSHASQASHDNGVRNSDSNGNLVRFIPIKIRPDKQDPNNARTFYETVQNAKEDITHEELFKLLQAAEAAEDEETPVAHSLKRCFEGVPLDTDEAQPLRKKPRILTE